MCVDWLKRLSYGPGFGPAANGERFALRSRGTVSDKSSVSYAERQAVLTRAPRTRCAASTMRGVVPQRSRGTTTAAGTAMELPRRSAQVALPSTSWGVGHGMVRSACVRARAVISYGNAARSRGEHGDSRRFERLGHRRVRAIVGRIAGRCRSGEEAGLRPRMCAEAKRQALARRSERLEARMRQGAEATQARAVAREAQARAGRKARRSGTGRTAGRARSAGTRRFAGTTWRCRADA